MSHPVIDIHNHVIPEEILEMAATKSELGVRIESDDGTRRVVHKEGYSYPLHRSFISMDAKIHQLQALQVDRAVVSVAPPFFLYHLESKTSKTVCREINRGISRMVRESKGLLYGMATLPMQDPEAIVGELNYAIDTLQLVGAEIGPPVQNIHLDDPSYIPFFKYAAELNIPILIHPYYTGAKPGMADYYLTNVIGNPLDTTICLTRLAYSGFFQKVGRLKLIAAHGGGYVPYQIGRADHACAVRSECRESGSSPSQSLREVYYDTVLFSSGSLQLLVEWASPGHVVLGSDAPFDMGDENPCQVVRKARLSSPVKAQILGMNAVELFSLPL